ncbi:MAG: hypothetical protein IT321_26320 [Anaerolineae bacterium]|nr:hypothetical protein [Anaerolineae bacterium]
MTLTPHSHIGVDVGKKALDVSWHDGSSPRKYPVARIEYEDTLWYTRLLDLIDPDALIVAEPTGWHLLTPLATVLSLWRPSAQLWLLNTTQTKAIRKAFVSSSKTDALDARTLALVAHKLGQGEEIIGLKLFDQHLASVIGDLRLRVNAYVRATRFGTRARNQINAFGHSLWPSLAIRRATWMPLAAQGIVTPADLHRYALTPEFADLHHASRAAIARLINECPNIEGNPIVATSISELANQIRLYELQAETLEQQIIAAIECPPFAELTALWRTVPAASDIAIACLHVATQGYASDIGVDSFKSACGVSPLSSISGDINKTRKNRKGYRPAMGQLHLWAMRLLSPNFGKNPILDYHDRTQDMAATKAKLVRILSGIARSGQPYHYSGS